LSLYLPLITVFFLQQLDKYFYQLRVKLRPGATAELGHGFGMVLGFPEGVSGCVPGAAFELGGTQPNLVV